MQSEQGSETPIPASNTAYLLSKFGLPIMFFEDEALPKKKKKNWNPLGEKKQKILGNLNKIKILSYRNRHGSIYIYT